MHEFRTFMRMCGQWSLVREGNTKTLRRKDTKVCYGTAKTPRAPRYLLFTAETQRTLRFCAACGRPALTTVIPSLPIAIPSILCHPERSEGSHSSRTPPTLVILNEVKNDFGHVLSL